MAKFKHSNKKEAAAINTASLPDIVFMLIMFFMVSTVMRELTLKIELVVPNATEVKTIEKKELVSYIHIGKPMKVYQGLYGTEPRIQLNDAFATIDDIRNFVSSEREQLNEYDKKQMFVSLKVDMGTKMGIISDIKQELRKASALKINYSAIKVEKIW